MGEFVTRYEASAWYGVAAPKGTPDEIIDRLNGEINAALVDPRISARLADLGGGVVLQDPPAEFGRLTAAEAKKWGILIKAAGIKPV